MARTQLIVFMLIFSLVVAAAVADYVIANRASLGRIAVDGNGYIHTMEANLFTQCIVWLTFDKEEEPYPNWSWRTCDFGITGMKPTAPTSIWETSSGDGALEMLVNSGLCGTDTPFDFSPYTDVAVLFDAAEPKGDASATLYLYGSETADTRLLPFTGVTFAVGFRGYTWGLAGIMLDSASAHQTYDSVIGGKAHLAADSMWHPMFQRYCLTNDEYITHWWSNGVSAYTDTGSWSGKTFQYHADMGQEIVGAYWTNGSSWTGHLDNIRVFVGNINDNQASNLINSGKRGIGEVALR